MTFERADYTLDEPIPVEMRTVAGEALMVTVTAFDTDVDRLELHGAVKFEQWDLVVDSGAFHVDLQPDELSGGGDADVDVVLVLRAPVMAWFDDIDAIVASLFGEPHMLHQTEAWLLASAMQRVEVPDAPGATASLGFRTEWAAPLTD